MTGAEIISNQPTSSVELRSEYFVWPTNRELSRSFHGYPPKQVALSFVQFAPERWFVD
jgi:hypothetical protein